MGRDQRRQRTRMAAAHAGRRLRSLYRRPLSRRRQRQRDGLSLSAARTVEGHEPRALHAAADRLGLLVVLSAQAGSDDAEAVVAFFDRSLAPPKIVRGSSPWASDANPTQTWGPSQKEVGNKKGLRR